MSIICMKVLAWDKKHFAWSFMLWQSGLDNQTRHAMAWYVCLISVLSTILMIYTSSIFAILCANQEARKSTDNHEVIYWSLLGWNSDALIAFL